MIFDALGTLALGEIPFPPTRRGSHPGRWYGKIGKTPRAHHLPGLAPLTDDDIEMERVIALWLMMDDND